jgi:hypothetical protein
MKKEQTDSHKLSGGATDKLAETIAAAIENLQQGFSRKMNKHFEGVGLVRARWIMGVFALLFGGYSLYLIGDVLVRPEAENLMPPEQISKPKNLQPSGFESRAPVTVDKETFLQMRIYRLFLDSLKSEDPFRYDSLLSVRPGLPDSIRLLEVIYHSQQNSSYEK